jgi:hypothetical protein
LFFRKRNEKEKKDALPFDSAAASVTNPKVEPKKR